MSVSLLILLALAMCCCLGVVTTASPGPGGSESGGVPAPAPTPSPAASPAPSPPSGTSPQPSPSGSAALPVQTLPGAAVAQPGAPAQPFDLRQFGEQFLPGISQRYQDPAALARELFTAVAQARDQQQYVQIGQRFQPHASEFEQFLAEKKKQADLQSQQQQKWWNAPEYDPQWMNQVYQDPATGQLVAKPGAPVDLPNRIQAYREFQTTKLTEFMKDPIKFLEGGLERYINPMMEKALNDRFEKHQAQQFAQSYVQRNLDWIAQKDAAGNPIPDGRGGWAMTPVGNRMAEYVDALHKAGITNPQVQQAIAEKMLMGDLAALKGTQPAAGATVPPGTPPAAPAFAGLTAPAGGGNYGQAAHGLPPGASLRDEMLKAFADKGISLGQIL